MEYKNCRLLFAKHVLPQLDNPMKDGEYLLLMIGFTKGVTGRIALVANGRGFDGSERSFVVGVALPGRGFDDKKTFLGAKARDFVFFLAFFERRNFFIFRLFSSLRDFFISRLFWDLRNFLVVRLFLDLEDFFVLRSFFNRSGFFRSKACFLWDFLLIFLGPE
jgi:hypothetical protein